MSEYAEVPIDTWRKLLEARARFNDDWVFRGQIERQAAANVSRQDLEGLRYFPAGGPGNRATGDSGLSSALSRIR